MQRKSRRLRAAALLGAVWAVVVASACSQSIDERIPVDNGGRLLIDLPLGDVHIESHDAGEVRIELEASGLNSLALSLDLSHSGDDVVLRGELGFLRVRLFDALDLNVTAFVPRDYDVHVETRSGELRVSDLEGEVRLENRHGNVSAEKIEGDVKVSVRNGNVWLEDIRGATLASARNGQIEAERIDGTLDCETRNASIEIRDVRGPVRADTRNGPAATGAPTDEEGKEEKEECNRPTAHHPRSPVSLS